MHHCHCPNSWLALILPLPTLTRLVKPFIRSVSLVLWLSFLSLSLSLSFWLATTNRGGKMVGKAIPLNAHATFPFFYGYLLTCYWSPLCLLFPISNNVKPFLNFRRAPNLVGILLYGRLNVNLSLSNPRIIKPNQTSRLFFMSSWDCLLTWFQRLIT